MKKCGLLLILFSFYLLVGCTLGNTPTSRVEAYLSDYQMLDDSIKISYMDLVSVNDMGTEIRSWYEDMIKRQYKNMAYEIKEEVVDGNEAIVTIEIEVMNYKEAIAKYKYSDYDSSRYHELVLNELENTKEMVTYTIDFSLTKGDNDEWVVDNLTDEAHDKLLGIY